jgi:hypothetical protein
MGVPLLVALIGPAAAGPMISTILADLFVTTSLCVALAHAHDAAGQGARHALWLALRGAASNPLPWSIALGAAAETVRPDPLLEQPAPHLLHQVLDQLAAGPPVDAGQRPPHRGVKRPRVAVHELVPADLAASGRLPCVLSDSHPSAPFERGAEVARPRDGPDPTCPVRRCAT